MTVPSRTRIGSRASAAGQILFVAGLLGALLSQIFLPLLLYAEAMKDPGEYRTWVAEWIGFTVATTLFLCRREVAVLFGLRPPERKPPTNQPPGPGRN